MQSWRFRGQDDGSGGFEEALVGVALAFWAEAGSGPLTLRDLRFGEAGWLARQVEAVGVSPRLLFEGRLVAGDDLAALVRLGLRQALLCRLEATGRLALTVGAGPWLLVTGFVPFPQALRDARAWGLVVEPVEEPTQAADASSGAWFR